MKIIALLAVSIIIFTSCNNDKKENSENKVVENKSISASTDCFSTDYEKVFAGTIQINDKSDQKGTITFKKINCTSCNMILSTGETIEITNLMVVEGDGYKGKTNKGNIRIGRIKGKNNKGLAVDIMDNGFFHFMADKIEMEY